MQKIIISGCQGRLGQAIDSALCSGIAVSELDLVAGVDISIKESDLRLSPYPIYEKLSDYEGKVDVVIDCSNPAALPQLLDYCTKERASLVLCTTGYSDADEAVIEMAANQIPIFKSGNMSLGIHLLANLIRKAAHVLEGFDIEIVERHHRKKLDAPSGTAFMLADAARDGVSYDPDYVYQRQSVRRERGTREIGISAVRGGTIVGEHGVIFAGLDEVIELKHSAASRNAFATGAIAAAKFMATVKTPGIYTMDHIVTSD